MGCQGGATQGHHVFNKSMHGKFRYDLRNGVPICTSCHLLERYKPAVTVVYSMRHMGTRAFLALAKDVMAVSGSHPWTIPLLRDVIDVLEAKKKTGSRSPRPA